MRLRELRELNNKTQNETAKLLGIAPSTYKNYEYEQSQPSIEQLKRIADYYQVSLDYLCNRNFQNELGYLTKQEYEYVKTLLQLNDQNKYKILFKAIALLNEQ